jgi:hypothetical protein
MSRVVDVFRVQALQSSVSTDSLEISSDLTTTFAEQLSRWREISIVQWRALSGISPQTGGDVQFEVYEQYARLVIQSLALQNTLNNSPRNLPTCFIEVSLGTILN